METVGGWGPVGGYTCWGATIVTAAWLEAWHMLCSSNAENTGTRGFRAMDTTLTW